MASLVFPNLINRNDVGMIQFGGGLRFDMEPLDESSSRQRAVEDHFQRHRSIQAELARPIHHAHTAASYFFQ